MFKVIEQSADCEMRSVIHFLNARNVKPADIHYQLCELYGEDAISDGWSGDGLGSSTKAASLCMTNSLLVGHLWSMTIWCVLSIKKFVRTGGSQFLHSPWIFHNFQGAFSTKLWQINCDIENCAHDGYSRCSPRNTTKWASSHSTVSKAMSFLTILWQVTRFRCITWHLHRSSSPWKECTLHRQGKRNCYKPCQHARSCALFFGTKKESYSSNSCLRVKPLIEKPIVRPWRSSVAQFRTRDVGCWPTELCCSMTTLGHTQLVTPKISSQNLAGNKLTNPPYSPDLALNDFHLFLHLKTFLGGKCFDDDDEVKTAVREWFASQVGGF